MIHMLLKGRDKWKTRQMLWSESYKNKYAEKLNILKYQYQFFILKNEGLFLAVPKQRDIITTFIAGSFCK